MSPLLLFEFFLYDSIYRIMKTDKIAFNKKNQDSDCILCVPEITMFRVIIEYAAFSLGTN